MTVKELCKKYKISHQAVYAKIRKKKNLLDGHIFKDGCLMLDDYAAEMLKPISAGGRYFEESEILKNELAKKGKDFENLQDELYFKNEKIAKLENSLNDKISEIEILQKRLDEENCKNADLTKSVIQLTDEITEKSKVIEKLKQEAEQSPEGQGGSSGKVGLQQVAKLFSIGCKKEATGV